jgi:hypothetical protein
MQAAPSLPTAEWAPHDLCSCIGSDTLGIITAMLALGVCFWYALIAAEWWRAAQEASPDGRRLWQWLIVIFAGCAVAGYATVGLMLWHPKQAVVIRLIALAVQNIACPIFIVCASSRSFRTVGRHEAIGCALSAPNVTALSDKDLADLARKLVIASIKRVNHQPGACV